MKNKINNKEFNFEDFTPRDFNELSDMIQKKVGRRPENIPADLPKGDWSSQSVQVLKERYLLRDEKGRVKETPDGLCWRVAWEVASAEVVWGASTKEVLTKAKDFYKLLASHEFLPNSPTLMNAGAGNKLQYSGCFVIPIEDSLTGIFDAIKYQALIHQTGGGTGFSFSRLRPKGSIVRSSMGVASGPVSFMRVFDAATNEVKQGGKRRGANMGILRVDHPDIEEFINCKKNGGITNFNISVAITDKFMEAYSKDTFYELINPKDKKVVGKLKATEVFDKISNLAWQTGDPGLIFIDRINRSVANPVPSLGPIESTNPCGEQPLYPFDSCNLGSIFLTYFVKEEGDKKEVDWEKLKNTVYEAVRFLDNVIEVNPYTLPQIRKTTLAIRRIGLGVGGWADMLCKLDLPYDSMEACDLAEKLMAFISQSAQEESVLLAEKRGAFPMFSQSIYKNKSPRRNSTLTTIAPTGSISIIANSSSGIEPLFAVAYEHRVKDKHLNRKLSFVNPSLVELGKKMGFWSEEVEKKVTTTGSVKHIAEIPEEVRKIFTTAHEIDPSWHVRMQSSFQKGTENAVSKTVNLKHDATVEDVKKSYLAAWDLNCNGVTVFRDGSKSEQVLNMGVGKTESNGEIKNNNIFINGEGDMLLKRPYVMNGSTYRMATPVGSAFITINEDENKNPQEVFINVGKAGSDVAAMAEALGRTISLSLRLMGNLDPKKRIEEVASQLSGIGGRRSVGFGQSKVRSLPDAISIAICKHYSLKINGNGHSEAILPLTNPEVTLQVGEVLTSQKEGNFLEGEDKIKGDLCPSCGLTSFVYQEGCAKCHSCGYSEC